MSFKISPDMPQWFLDLCNRVDWKKVGTIKFNILLGGIKMYAPNLPKKVKGVVYPKGNAALRITPDVPQKILDAVADIDYRSLSERQTSDIKGFLTTYINGLPQK